jgi:ATP-dependent Lhr-like helicase
LREALWDLVWAGEVTNDAWAPLRAPRLALARSERQAGRHTAIAGDGSGRPGGASRLGAGRGSVGRSRFAARRRGGGRSGADQTQGRWSLTHALFRGEVEGPAGARERRRTLAELLLERYGIVTREQVLAEGIKGGFAMLYDTFAQLETLGICRRGYFIEGMGGAQFALPGAVERLRAGTASIGSGGVHTGGSPGAAGRSGAKESASGRALVLAAADPAQPYGAALPWPRREGAQSRLARVAGAYLVMVEDAPVLYVERGGRGLVTLVGGAGSVGGVGGAAGGGAGRGGDATREALAALAEAVRQGRVGKLALERIDGQSAIASGLAETLIELGFSSGPRRLTLSA